MLQCPDVSTPRPPTENPAVKKWQKLSGNHLEIPLPWSSMFFVPNHWVCREMDQWELPSVSRFVPEKRQDQPLHRTLSRIFGVSSDFIRILAKLPLTLAKDNWPSRFNETQSLKPKYCLTSLGRVPCCRRAFCYLILRIHRWFHGCYMWAHSGRQKTMLGLRSATVTIGKCKMSWKIVIVEFGNVATIASIFYILKYSGVLPPGRSHICIRISIQRLFCCQGNWHALPLPRTVHPGMLESITHTSTQRSTQHTAMNPWSFTESAFFLDKRKMSNNTLETQAN